MSGEKRNVSGNAFASALRAWQPAVGIRECHRIFCCTSYCLRALSVCVPLLRTGTVSAAVTCSSGAASLFCGLLLCAGAEGVVAAAVPRFVRREELARKRQRIPVVCTVGASAVTVGLCVIVGLHRLGLAFGSRRNESEVRGCGRFIGGFPEFMGWIMLRYRVKVKERDKDFRILDE